MNKIKQELDFTKHCTKTYSLQSKVAPRPRLVKSIVHDMVTKSGHSIYELAANLKYSNDLQFKSKQTDEWLAIDTFVVNYSRPDIMNCQPAMEENKSHSWSNSTDAEESTNKKEVDKKGFKPKSGFKWNAGDNTFDLIEDDQLLQEKFGFRKLCKMSVMDAWQNRVKLAEFFTRYSMSDELRKQFWKARIGNRLRISRPLFDSLVDRLAAEGISRKAEKTIGDDLDRTFPICNDMAEGKEMYQNMKLVLSLFEVIFKSCSYIGLILAMYKE